MASIQPDPHPIRAPQDAIAWTPDDGFIYEAADLPDRINAGHYVLVVTDGYVRSVTDTTTAPLAAVLRIDTDLTELVQALNDVAEFIATKLAEQ